MDRLARCPECGGVTHPLAEHLVDKGKTSESPANDQDRAVSAPGRSTRTQDSDVPQTIGCANCGEPLGKLQKPMEWDSHPVCGPCYRELSLQKAGVPAQTATTAIAVRQAELPESAVQTPGAPAVVLDGLTRSRAPTRKSNFAISIRSGVLLLCAAAIALYAIVAILESLRILIVYGAVIVAVLAAIFWIRRGIRAFRRKLGFPGASQGARQVRAVVRD